MSSPLYSSASAEPAKHPGRKAGFMGHSRIAGFITGGQYTRLTPVEANNSSKAWKHLANQDSFLTRGYSMSGQDDPDSVNKTFKFRYDTLCKTDGSSWYTVWTEPDTASDQDAEPAGLLSFSNIRRRQRRIEIDSVIFGQALRKNRASTEAFYLALGSEGNKGQSQDTACFCVTEDEWPLVKRALEAWLGKDNFDSERKQIKKLRDIREALRLEADAVSSSTSQEAGLSEK